MGRSSRCLTSECRKSEHISDCSYCLLCSWCSCSVQEYPRAPVLSSQLYLSDHIHFLFSSLYKNFEGEGYILSTCILYILLNWCIPFLYIQSSKELLIIAEPAIDKPRNHSLVRDLCVLLMWYDVFDWFDNLNLW